MKYPFFTLGVPRTLAQGSGGAAGKGEEALGRMVTVEPLPAESPLWDMPNVLISPHSASTVDAENATLTSLFCDNLRRWLDGAPLLNVYSREKGY